MKLQVVSKQEACFNVIWIIYCFIIILTVCDLKNIVCARVIFRLGLDQLFRYLQGV